MVPRARSRVISRSTSAASRTPSEAVGSSSSRIRGLCAIARATATICRCPPDSILTGRVVSRSGMPSRSSSLAASLCSATSENRCLRRSLPSITFAATSRFSASARSCQTTRTPSFAAADGDGGTAWPPTRIDPATGVTSPAMALISVVLPAPFSPASATISPARSARCTPSSAVSAPNRTVSADTASSGVGSPCPAPHRSSQSPLLSTPGGKRPPPRAVIRADAVTATRLRPMLVTDAATPRLAVTQSGTYPGEPEPARGGAGSAAVGEAALTVTGVDGCAAGWVAVTLSASVPGPAGPGRQADPDAAAALARARARRGPLVVGVTVAATLDLLPLAGVTGIDMPLGLLGAGWRDADLLARRALGRRGVTVFAIPPRAVWECQSYAEANRLCRELTGKGISAQAWGLRRKITEADQFRRRAAAGPHGVQLYEVHPELSFAALAGAPLPDSKHTPAGLAVRRDCSPGQASPCRSKVAGAAENDLLDAAAVAWSARRIAAGTAVTLTSPGQPADDGTEIAIRY